MRWFDEVHVDPADDNRVYVLGVNLYMSSDGGRTFDINESAVQSGLWPVSNGLYLFNTSTHSDHRGFWIDPKNPEHLITGNDGGLCISYERGKTWDCVDNMDLSQVYHVGFDMDVPYRLFIGLHDNLGWGGPSATRSFLGVGDDDWFLVAGGDGFVATADPTNSRTIYAESQNGNMSRVDRVTNERVPIRPEPAESEEPYKWNFNTPDADLGTRSEHAADRGEPAVQVHRSRTVLAANQPRSDRKDSRRRAVCHGHAPQEREDRATDTELGQPSSPSRNRRKSAGVYYTGADDGTVQVSRDDGLTWTNISTNFPGLPQRTVGVDN